MNLKAQTQPVDAKHPLAEVLLPIREARTTGGRLRATSVRGYFVIDPGTLSAAHLDRGNWIEEKGRGCVQTADSSLFVMLISPQLACTLSFLRDLTPREMLSRYCTIAFVREEYPRRDGPASSGSTCASAEREIAARNDSLLQVDRSSFLNAARERFNCTLDDALVCLGLGDV